MNLNQIDNTTRRCDSKLVRQSCAFQRGRSPLLSDRTWAKYRQLCRVPKSAKVLTDREAFLLLVCADLHRRGGDRISYLQIVSAADKRLLECGNTPVEQLRQLTAATVKGVDLPRVLSEMTGRSVSLRTLYRWGQRQRMPRFSLNAEYNPAQLRLWLNAAA